MKEALKLALEALAEMSPSGPIGSEIWHKQMNAIRVAGDALAQPEQEPLGFMNAGHVHEMQQGRLPYGYVYPKEGVGADIAVYTTPPKRPWVGLTEEQREACTQSPFTEDNYDDIEAKLKELNT